MSDNRNMILAIVLSAIVLIGWTLGSKYFAPVASRPSVAYQGGRQIVLPQPQADPTADGPQALRDRAVVLRATPRIAIDTPRLKGSINLAGARIDDLVLVDHKETIARDSAPIRLLSPGGAADAYFAGFGWTGANVALPDEHTVWKAAGGVLAPGRPVTLSWDNGHGQVFLIRFEVDRNYMFTATQGVRNAGPAAVAIVPYALISRTGISKDPDTWTMHSGPIGNFGNGVNYDIGYANLKGTPPSVFARIFGSSATAGSNYFATRGGWLGFGDKYWLTALVPDQRAEVHSGFRAASGRFQADFSGSRMEVAPGATALRTEHVFAGAKEVNVLADYERTLGIPLFDRAIDWGWFIWFEKPIFYLLDWIFRMTGNFGVAIILLTLIVRGAMFPIAQRQFQSMAKMRSIQPRMKALQERHKDDKARLQQEMMAMYQKEKINPVGGCLPIFLQIPIFYALYKVLMLTIEMRHQPFALWIKDLSAPDPLSPVNLFGLLPFTPPHAIAIGVLPILLGITMYFQQKLNPAPMDATQKQIFAFMPWIFMFIMAPFAAGLQLYWTVSNLLTIGQQSWLYSRDPSLKAAPAK